jgi:hypothetical protein
MVELAAAVSDHPALARIRFGQKASHTRHKKKREKTQKKKTATNQQSTTTSNGDGDGDGTGWLDLASMRARGANKGCGERYESAVGIALSDKKLRWLKQRQHDHAPGARVGDGTVATLIEEEQEDSSDGGSSGSGSDSGSGDDDADFSYSDYSDWSDSETDTEDAVANAGEDDDPRTVLRFPSGGGESDASDGNNAPAPAPAPAGLEDAMVVAQVVRSCLRPSWCQLECTGYIGEEAKRALGEAMLALAHLPHGMFQGPGISRMVCDDWRIDRATVHLDLSVSSVATAAAAAAAAPNTGISTATKPHHLVTIDEAILLAGVLVHNKTLKTLRLHRAVLAVQALRGNARGACNTQRGARRYVEQETADLLKGEDELKEEQERDRKKRLVGRTGGSGSGNAPGGLTGWGKCTKRSVDLSHCFLTAEDAVVIGHLVSVHPRLTELDLTGNNLCSGGRGEGVGALAVAVGRSNTLETLCLSRNEIGGAAGTFEATVALIRAVTASPTLTWVDLSANALAGHDGKTHGRALLPRHPRAHPRANTSASNAGPVAMALEGLVLCNRKLARVDLSSNRLWFADTPETASLASAVCRRLGADSLAAVVDAEHGHGHGHGYAQAAAVARPDAGMAMAGTPEEEEEDLNQPSPSSSASSPDPASTPLPGPTGSCLFVLKENCVGARTKWATAGERGNPSSRQLL